MWSLQTLARILAFALVGMKSLGFSSIWLAAVFRNNCRWAETIAGWPLNHLGDR